MTLGLRAWSDDDVGWWVALRRAWYPAAPAAALHAMLTSPDVDWRLRAVAERDGERAGAVTVRVPPGEVTHLGWTLVVDPQHRGTGTGSALWRECRAVLHGQSAITAMPDSDRRSRAVLTHWGFEVMSHSITSTTDLEPEPAPAPPPGVHLLSLTDAEVDARGLDLDPLLLESATEPEAEILGWRFRRKDLQHMNEDLHWVLAERDGALVAVAVAGPESDGVWSVVFTGVVPGYRRQGLGRLVKDHLHARLQERGVVGLTTDNEMANVAILALNSRLGYRVVGGELRLVHPRLEPLG